MVARLFTIPFALILATASIAPANAAQREMAGETSWPPSPIGAAPGFGYADTADLVLAAPIIADATIRSASRIKGAEAASVPAGSARFYVEADVGALIRGTNGVPPRVGYLLDAPLDAGGRPPRLKKMRVMLFARPVAGSSATIQLVAPDAQVPWSAPLDARSRAIAAAALAADAPPPITGMGNAFFVPGALPGEGETQVFLTTADNQPVSLSVLRRPGERPRWAVALSEIVDEAAGPPAPETLLWYRLACSLPRVLPDRSTGSLSATDAEQARADYRFVVDALGPCGRTRG